jgi:hypothetical protein
MTAFKPIASAAMAGASLSNGVEKMSDEKKPVPEEKKPTAKATKKPGPKVSMTAAQAKKLGLDPFPYGGK